MVILYFAYIFSSLMVSSLHGAVKTLQASSFQNLLIIKVIKIKTHYMPLAVNFINILRAKFSYEILEPKIQTQNTAL